MRLTTKIITGIILSIFLLSLLHIIGYSFTDRKNYKPSFSHSRSIQIPQTDMTGIPVESYRVITIEAEQSDTDNRFWSYFANDENGLYIHPATTSDEENKLFIPESLHKFITVQTSRDTLKIKINLDEVREKYEKIDDATVKLRPSMRVGIPVSGVNLYLHTTKVNVINRLNSVQTRISNMETDSIQIYASGEINIDSCKANFIEPNSNRKITVAKSVVKAINIDLDRVSNWNVEPDCDVDVMYYTSGKSSNSILLHSDSRGKIVLQPKNKSAEFNVKIKGNAAQINFETQAINE